MEVFLNTSNKEKLEIGHLEVGPKISGEAETIDTISEEHKSYLIDKHGTYNLDPLPSMNDDDPYNWSKIRKNFQLGMISFHAFMCTFLASGVVPLYEVLTEELNRPLNDISYLTSVQILFYGIFPLIFLPLLERYGRHKILLMLTLFTSAFNVGCVFSKDYATLVVLRVFSAIFLSPGVALGGSAVAEMMFKHERASKTGWWTLMVAMGVPAGSFITGFIQQRAIVPSYKINVKGITHPFVFFYTKWRIFLLVLMYSIVFCYTNIVTSVELPAVFGENFHLGPQATGLQFLSVIIGYLIGIQMGGWISDWWMKKANYDEYRLWLSYPGFVTTFIGLLVFGFQVTNAEQGHWNITPLVGLAILSFGLQLVSTTLVTYCIDIDPSEASDIVLFTSLVRQVFGFIGPFYFPPMFESLGFDGAFGCLGGLCLLGMFPVIIVHILGVRSYSKQVTSIFSGLKSG